MRRLIGKKRQHRKQGNGQSRLEDRQRIAGVAVAGARAEAGGSRQHGKTHQQAGARDNCRERHCAGDEQGRGQRALAQRQHTAAEHQRADDQANLAEHEPGRLPHNDHPAGEKRDAHGDRGRRRRHQSDRAGGDRDHAKADQDIERQRADVGRSESLEALGLLRRELALFDQPGNIERDFHASFIQARDDRVSVSGKYSQPTQPS